MTTFSSCRISLTTSRNRCDANPINGAPILLLKLRFKLQLSPIKDTTLEAAFLKADKTNCRKRLCSSAPCVFSSNNGNIAEHAARYPAAFLLGNLATTATKCASGVVYPANINEKRSRSARELLCSTKIAKVAR